MLEARGAPGTCSSPFPQQDKDTEEEPEGQKAAGPARGGRAGAGTSSACSGVPAAGSRARAMRRDAPRSPGPVFPCPAMVPQPHLVGVVEEAPPKLQQGQSHQHRGCLGPPREGHQQRLVGVVQAAQAVQGIGRQQARSLVFRVQLHQERGQLVHALGIPAERAAGQRWPLPCPFRLPRSAGHRHVPSHAPGPGGSPPAGLRRPWCSREDPCSCHPWGPLPSPPLNLPPTWGAGILHMRGSSPPRADPASVSFSAKTGQQCHLWGWGEL